MEALSNKKKLVVTEATIREALHLDDAEGVDCLPNEEIFADLARMGYEKPSTKLMFYKAFFSSQQKFLIHTILQCMSAKRTSWNEFSSSMAFAIICLSSGKGFSGVETPLFEGMLVEQEIKEEGDADEHVKEVTDGDAAHGDVSAAHREVPTVTEEPSIPSPTPPSPPPQPPQDLPLTSRVQQTPPQSPQLKRRVKKLEKRNKVTALKLRRLQRVGTSQRVVTSNDTVMDDESNQGRMIAKMDQDDAVVQLKDSESESTTSIIIPAETKSKDKAKRRKLDEEVEEIRRHLQIVLNEDDDVYTEATPLARKVPVVDYQVIEMNNKRYYKIIRADNTHQLYISFLSLVRNFNREDLEALWRLVNERFSTTRPKNFSEDFLLVTLGAMFEKPDIHPQIWKTQRNEHGSTKVKGWNLLELCGVQIITFTSTQLILLLGRKYPLTIFTLNQMLNAIRPKAEEESEVYLELLRFTRKQHQEGQ
nr:hypothetical protein [Tanacetum cinerariifolium]